VAGADLLIGRTGALGAVGRGLRGARLVTVAGPPGVGKTAVAAEIAAQAATAGAFDGVWTVRLDDLMDDALLPHTVARVLGVPDPLTGDATDLLIDWLRDREPLIVLDTCEHLVDACAGLTTALLSACPDVRILATSREPLRAGDEHIVPLPPLDPPDAMTLFARRAREVRPGFRLTPTLQMSAAVLCRKLDGLPLAIELAAQRMDIYTIDQVLKDLDEGFHLLRSRSVLPARHRTLRAAIGWSHQLCTPAERLMWAWLSAFEVPFTMVDADDVCADERLSRDDALQAVTGLVDKSILLVDETDTNAVRFRLPETLRVYGSEMLHLLGDAERVTGRYRAWCAPGRTRRKIGMPRSRYHGDPAYAARYTPRSSSKGDRAMVRAASAHVGRLSVRARSLPADPAGGGDVYDAVATRYGERLLVGDVMGKGPDALRAAGAVLRAWRDVAHAEPRLAGCAVRLDGFVTVTEDRFVTAALVGVDEDDSAELVCCGHPPPLLLRGGTAATLPAVPVAPPLGMLDLSDGWCRTARIPFLRGDRLLLFTDGVSEARGDDGAYFALARNATAALRPGRGDLLETLLAGITRHTGGRPYARDDALLVLAARR